MRLAQFPVAYAIANAFAPVSPGGWRKVFARAEDEKTRKLRMLAAKSLRHVRAKEGRSAAGALRDELYLTASLPF